MSPRLFAKLKEQDPDFRSRIVTLKTNNKSILTPRRVLDLGGSYSESRIIKNDLVRGINEVTRTLNEETLQAISSDKERMIMFTRDLRSRFSRINVDNEISFFLFFYNSNGKPPAPKYIDLLANLVSGNHYNDIIVPPIIRGVSSEDYIKYLNSFVESLETYTRNPQIMGTIPHVTHIELREICDFYMEHGVTVFALDMDGKNPLDMYPNINEVYRMICNIEHELSGEECCFLHGINLRKPRGLLKKGFASARDILVFEMGFNSFGKSHILQKIDPSKIPPDNIKWILSRHDYAYYPTTSNEARSIPQEIDPSITLNEVLSNNVQAREKARLFNTERQGVEAKEIQKRLAEDGLSNYLDAKSKANESLQQIKKKMPLQPSRLSDVF